MILASANRRAVLLLEIIVAMTIMIASMAFVGAQMVGGLRMVAYADQQARAGELADRMLAILELDPQATQRLMQDLTDEGDFGDQYPAYMWRVTVEPLTDVDGLSQVSIEILYQSDPEQYGEIDTSKVVHQLHLLKADPGRIDLAADFGIDDEKIEQITDLIPIAGFDPTQLNPQELVSLDPLELLSMLPDLLPLLQQFGGGGGGADALAGLDPTTLSQDDVRQLLLQQLSAAGGAAGGNGPPAGAGSGGTGRNGQIPTGADAPPGLEELLRLRDELNAGGGAVPPRLTPQSGGQRGARGRNGGGGGRGGQTIRDFNRSRDEADRVRGTRGGGGS